LGRKRQNSGRKRPKAWASYRGERTSNTWSVNHFPVAGDPIDLAWAISSSGQAKLTVCWGNISRRREKIFPSLAQADAEKLHISDS
jgi:hypothetical protein